MNKTPRRAFRHVIAASLVTALAACGGGGGGGGNEPIEVPDGARAENASANSDVSAGNFDQLAGPMARLVISSGGNPRQTEPLVANRNLTTMMRASMQKLRASGSGSARAQVQAEFTNSIVCPGGGTLTTTLDDDGDGVLGAGDGIDYRFVDCSIDGVVPEANGGYFVNVEAVDYDARDNIVGLIVDGRYDDLSIGSLTLLDGAFRIWDTWSSSGTERYRISYDDVRSIFLTQRLTYNVDIDGVADATGNTFAIDGALGIGGATFKIVQDRALFNSDGTTFPSSGALYLEDARGDTLRLIARSETEVDFDFTPNGASRPTDTLYGLDWDEFE